MLISFFQGNSPGLDLGNLKVAEGLAGGDGICPLRCLVLQDSPRGPFAVGERSEQPIGGFVFGGWFPAEWAEQVIINNDLIEFVVHGVLYWWLRAGARLRLWCAGCYREYQRLLFGCFCLGCRFGCEEEAATQGNGDGDGERGEDLNERFHVKGDPGADVMSAARGLLLRAWCAVTDFFPTFIRALRATDDRDGSSCSHRSHQIPRTCRNRYRYRYIRYS